MLLITEPRKSLSGRLFRKSQCQPTQTFLFLHMMKVRDLSLFGKLRRHRLSPLVSGWRSDQSAASLKQWKYGNLSIEEVLKYLFPYFVEV